MEIKAAVLVVDDDPHMLKTMEDILGIKGFDAITVPSGRTAVQMAQERAFDVVLIDLRLGDMPGMEVLRAIRQHSPESACILLTGHASQDTAIEALNLGAYSYIQKPFEVESLVLTIRHAAEQHMAEKALAESQARYHTFINATTDMAWLKDDHFRYIIVNQANADFFGRPIEQIIGRDDFELMDREMAESFRRSDQETLQAGETRIFMESNGGRTYETRKFPVPLQDGRTGVGGYGRDVTEMINAEQAIRQSEAHYRGLFQASPISLWEEDFSQVKQRLDALRKRGVKDVGAYLRAHPDFAAECIAQIRILDVNQATLDLYHAASREHFFKDIKINYQADPESFNQELVNIAAGRNNFNWEGTNQALDGQSLDISLNWSAAPGHEQDLARVIISLVDFTERKRAETLLKEQEANYRTLFEYSPISLWDQDFSLVKIQLEDLRRRGVKDLRKYLNSHPDFVGKCVALIRVNNVNKATLELYKAESLEAIATNFRSVLGRDINHGFIEQLLRIDAGILQYNGEAQERRMDGQPLHISLTWSVAPGHERDYSKVFISIVDITERIEAEQALRESEARYRMLAENMSDTVWLMDMNLDTVYISPSVTRLRGFTLEEIDSLSLEEQLTPESVIRAKQAIAEILAPQRLAKSDLPISVMMELEFFRKDGSSFWSESNFVLIRDEQGNPVNILGSGRDISERKQAEAEILRRVNDLEVIYENGIAISRMLEPAEIANRTIEILGSRLSWHHVAIRFQDPVQNKMEILALSHPGLTKAQRHKHIERLRRTTAAPGSGLSGWVAVHGVSVLCPDVDRDERYVRTFPGVRSGMYVPLTVGGQVVGTIAIESRQAEAFNEPDLRLLETIAAQASIALMNAHLYQAAQKELSERQRTEIALRQSQGRLQSILDNASAQIYIKDLEGKYLLINKAFCQMTDLPDEKILGKTVFDLLNQAEAELCARNDATVIRLGSALTFEEMDSHRGVLQTYLSVKFPIKDEQNKTYALCGISTDITDLKTAEEQLQLLSYAVEQSPSATLIANRHGIVQYVNPGFTRISGHEPAEVEGKDLLSLLITETHREKTQTIQTEIENGRGWSGELRSRRKNGEMYWEAVSISPIFNKDGQVTHYLVVKEDITQRKAVELTLQRSKVELEERVAQRTAELSSANAALARAAKLKDEFLASMSHELRTPLTGVLGLTEALQRQVYGELNSRQVETLHTIEESGRHLLNLINDILDLSKIEAGRMDLELARLSVDDLCQASLRLVKQMASAKHQSVAFDLKPAGLVVRADARRLKQVLFNLLGNAVKFTPENGELGLEVRGDQAKEEIRFMVWDKGIGIPEKDLPRLFQPFIQLDSSLARSYAGTGLGLSLAHRLVELHGGRIEVESRDGEGSRFTVTIPWLKSDTAPLWRGDIATFVTQKPMTAPGAPASRQCILLADDNEVNLQVVSDYLASEGYALVLARNGQQAIEAVTASQPDLILMDIQMPGMDGLEAIRRIRALPDTRLASLPVIALTALVMPGDRERCLQAGANEYLSKPVRLAELSEQIQSILEMNK